MKVLSVIGTRPEAIKMAPVIQELVKRDGVNSIVCTSGQHREMLQQALGIFSLVPDFELGLMQANQSLGGLTSALLTAIDRVLADTSPDWVLAQGDTTTVLATALSCHYRQIRFGHVEAGLRTYDKLRPFPEEMNRRLADDLSDLLFAPTEFARGALLKENIPAQSIVLTGNTVVDALLQVSKKKFDWTVGPLSKLSTSHPIVLITAHRRESFGEPFAEMCHAIRELVERFGPTGFQFVYPVHLNPNVRKPVQAILGGLEGLHLLEPLDYVTLVNLMKRSTLILTDSGGIQEEAPTFGVPLLVLRDTTERPEGVQSGVAKLIGTTRARIVAETSALLTQPELRAGMSGQGNPYGDGKASMRIVDALMKTT